MSNSTINSKFTPNFYHLLEDPTLREAVYEPEADSFLLLDALDADRTMLQKQCEDPKTNIARVLEVGCGSGILLSHVGLHILRGQQLQQPNHPLVNNSNNGGGEGDSLATDTPQKGECFYASLCVGVDMNPFALAATTKTWDNTLKDLIMKPGGATTSTVSSTSGSVPRHQSISCTVPMLQLIQGDLGSMFQLQKGEKKEDEWGGPFDIILFNPPYVPTSGEELLVAQENCRLVSFSVSARSIHSEGGGGRDCLPAAWAGGEKGRAVLDRFLPMIPRLLSPIGILYLVALEVNQPEEIIEKLAELSNQTMQGEIVQRRYTGEKLCILRFRRVEKKEGKV